MAAPRVRCATAGLRHRSSAPGQQSLQAAHRPGPPNRRVLVGSVISADPAVPATELLAAAGEVVSAEAWRPSVAFWEDFNEQLVGVGYAYLKKTAAKAPLAG